MKLKINEIKNEKTTLEQCAQKKSFWKKAKDLFEKISDKTKKAVLISGIALALSFYPAKNYGNENPIRYEKKWGIIVDATSTQSNLFWVREVSYIPISCNNEGSCVFESDKKDLTVDISPYYEQKCKNETFCVFYQKGSEFLTLLVLRDEKKVKMGTKKIKNCEKELVTYKPPAQLSPSWQGYFEGGRPIITWYPTPQPTVTTIKEICKYDKIDIERLIFKKYNLQTPVTILVEKGEKEYHLFIKGSDNDGIIHLTLDMETQKLKGYEYMNRVDYGPQDPKTGKIKKIIEKIEKMAQMAIPPKANNNDNNNNPLINKPNNEVEGLDIKKIREEMKGATEGLPKYEE